MPQTPAQRQAAYRARRSDGEGEHRLNGWISIRAHLALKRLARHEGQSRRNILKRLILAADDAVFRQLELDSLEWDAYVALRRNG